MFRHALQACTPLPFSAVASTLNSGHLQQMLKPRVYVETTIPSMYHEVRTTPNVVARREWTRQWWGDAPAHYELVTSPAVLDELSEGVPERSAQRLALVAALPLLPVEAPVVEIVQAYIQHKLMPGDPGGDALHLALASYHKCDFLVTWNCQHLANANKFGHIRRVNTLLGLYVPALVTPLELLGGANERDEPDE
jgi:predicted nucleic acid-binding protein